MKCCVIRLFYTMAFLLQHITGNLVESPGILKAGVHSAANWGGRRLYLVSSVPDSALLRNLMLSPSPVFWFGFHKNNIFHLYFGCAD